MKYSDIFHTYIGSGHFWGVQNFESHFFGFQKNEYFFFVGGGYFLGHHKIGLYLMAISMYFRVFS